MGKLKYFSVASVLWMFGMKDILLFCPCYALSLMNYTAIEWLVVDP